MKFILVGILNFSFVFLSCVKSQAATAKEVLTFPRISLLKGTAEYRDRLGKIDEIKIPLLLEGKASLIVSSNSIVRVDLSENDWLTVMANSKVDLLDINWSNGEIKKIFLHNGQVRLSREIKPGDVSGIVVSTPITETIVKSGDYLFSYDKETAISELLVFSGIADFSGYNDEDIKSVQSGQKINFNGILESGEPSFDILLQGRKIARGKLGALASIKQEELKKISDSTYIDRPKIIAKTVVIKRKPSQICSSPFGELNQCLWRCELNGRMSSCSNKSSKCIRYRCNANGEWSDPQQRSSYPIGACKSIPKVFTCDY